MKPKSRLHVLEEDEMRTDEKTSGSEGLGSRAGCWDVDKEEGLRMVGAHAICFEDRSPKVWGRVPLLSGGALRRGTRGVARHCAFVAGEYWRREHKEQERTSLKYTEKHLGGFVSFLSLGCQMGAQQWCKCTAGTLSMLRHVKPEVNYVTSVSYADAMHGCACRLSYSLCHGPGTGDHRSGAATYK